MSSSDNNKIPYQLWTDGNGSFAVKNGKREDLLFEYSNNNLQQQSYSKLIDSKMYFDGSITEELVQDWIEELKEEGILDHEGNLIYV